MIFNREIDKAIIDTHRKIFAGCYMLHKECDLGRACLFRFDILCLNAYQIPKRLVVFTAVFYEIKCLSISGYF